MSDKQVKQDQSFVENTLGLNKQSKLEREFSDFFDAERMDACEKMQLIYQNKEDIYLFVYYPRLACIIFEVFSSFLFLIQTPAYFSPPNNVLNWMAII